MQQSEFHYERSLTTNPALFTCGCLLLACTWRKSIKTKLIPMIKRSEHLQIFCWPIQSQFGKCGKGYIIIIQTLWETAQKLIQSYLQYFWQKWHIGIDLIFELPFKSLMGNVSSCAMLQHLTVTLSLGYWRILS